jgi:hypothetical protein
MAALSAIFRRYVHFLESFLVSHADHDIDGNGVMWCSKEDWAKFLSQHIDSDDANAIGNLYCRPENVRPDGRRGRRQDGSQRTVTEMLEVERRGRVYIAHRVYNMGYVKNLDRRKKGRNVTHFRLLKDGEKPAKPVPDAVTIMKAVFKKLGRQEGKSKKRFLSPEELWNNFFARIDPRRFPEEDQRVAEFNRVVGVLQKQGCLVCREQYEYTHLSWAEIQKRSKKKVIPS